MNARCLSVMLSALFAGCAVRAEAPVPDAAPGVTIEDAGTDAGIVCFAQPPLDYLCSTGWASLVCWEAVCPAGDHLTDEQSMEPDGAVVTSVCCAPK
jgi:hypothetical protein